MTQYTNLYGIDLSMAVWLVHDDYDFNPRERSISATGLLKPIRQIVLANRIQTESVEDLSSRIAMRLGHAVHDSIEQSWKRGYRKNLKKLGLPDSVIDRVKINPEPEEILEDTIPVFIEVRGSRQLDGWTISGKLDMSLNYRLKDAKTTSVFTYLSGSKDEDYALQMSIYRWLHPDKVKDMEGDIQFLFTDHQKAMAKTVSNYPPIRIQNHTVPLYDTPYMELWIRNRLSDLVRHFDAPQASLPRCTDEELWKSEDQYKYYADPTKTDGKSTKNFKDLAEANAHLASKGKGVVITVPGKVKACAYCPAFDICEQRKEYDFDD